MATRPVVPLLGPILPWPMGPSALPDTPRGPSLRPRQPLPGEPGGPVAVNDAHRYAELRGEVVVAVPTTAGGVLVLAAPDVRRNMVMIRNSSATANLYLSFGIQPTTASILYLTPNQIVLFDTVVPQDDIWALADAAGGQVSLAFSTF